MSQIQQVEAKVTTGDRANQVFIVNYEVPDNLEEAVKMFGESIVFDNFYANLMIGLQSYMRTQIKKDAATAASVQEAVDKAGPENTPWRPSLRAPAKSKIEKITDLLSGLSAEERARIMELVAGEE